MTRTGSVHGSAGLDLLPFRDFRPAAVRFGTYRVRRPTDTIRPQT